MLSETPKTPVVTQRRFIIKGPDGSSKIVTQNVVSQPAPTTQPNDTPKPQKVQIIRDPTGKITCHGLNPNQQLIKTADGKFHVITRTNTNNKESVVRNNAPNTKVVTKAVPQPQQVVTTNAQNVVQKSPVVIRHPAPKTPQGMVIKSVAQKPVTMSMAATTPTTTQRVSV